mgnify:FL=1
MIKLDAVPPSVNALYRNVPGVGRVKTQKYEQWIRSTGFEVIAQRPKAIEGRYHLTIRAERTGKRRDLDNILKALNDLLVKVHIVEDDSKMESVTASWSDDVEGCEIELKEAA